MDLLEDKVVRKKVDISKYFEEEFSDIDQVRKHVQKFNGDPLNLQDVKNFILYLFVTKQKFIHSQRPIYHHFTTAVNTKNIQFVFTSVKETILRKNLSALMLQWPTFYEENAFFCTYVEDFQLCDFTTLYDVKVNRPFLSQTTLWFILCLDKQWSVSSFTNS